MPRPPSKNFDTAWASLIQKTMMQGSNGRPAGEGWKTVKEFADSCTPKISAAHARNVLHDLIDLGAMDKAKGKNGGHWSIYYRPKM